LAADLDAQEKRKKAKKGKSKDEEPDLNPADYKRLSE
jgi:hypothetical protein